MAYQGDRWGIVPGCTCLWEHDRPHGWNLVTDDVNCPAHHPADSVITVVDHGDRAAVR